MKPKILSCPAYSSLIKIEVHPLIEKVCNTCLEFGLSQEHRFTQNLLSFLEQLTKQKHQTSVNMTEYHLRSLDPVLFHTDSEGDLGIFHPLTKDELTALSKHHFSTCPIGKKPLTKYQDLITYFLEKYKLSLSETLTEKEEILLEEKLRADLVISKQEFQPQPPDNPNERSPDLVAIIFTHTQIVDIEELLQTITMYVMMNRS